jgi:type VI secretion system secreted protein VgrG
MAAETGFFALRGDMLPADVRVARYRAVERLSVPYEVTVELDTRDPAFDVAACLRARLCLEVRDDSGAKRFFDGVCDRAAFVDVVAGWLRFRIRLRPALAALAHRAGCRIFQEKTIVQIVQKIFDEAGFADRVSWQHTKEYPPRDFVVQYRESELDFVHRLLEDYGIFYWFGHSEEGHTLALSDDAAAFAPQDETPVVHFTMTQGVAVGAEPLAHFSRTRSLRTTVTHLLDYDFEKPEARPEAVQPGPSDAAPAPFFEYPGGFVKSADGSLKANARLRELRHDADVVEGRSHAIGLRVGVPFIVDGAAQPDLNGTYVVTELVTEGRQHVGEGSIACDNRFRGIGAGAPYAPPRRTPRPRISGVQTAIVTGSSQQEQALHVDKYGRIKVRFYWDREGQQDHTSSAWLRVTQPPLGGAIFLPRIGWEVAVAFHDGDPDRPFVLGRVYNAEKTPPYALPAEKTSGSIKTWSSPGGGGHNEIKLGDSAGGQGFSIHAQKDLNTVIGNDKNETVGVDEEHNITVNESVSVGGDETVDIGANQSLDVGANLATNVGGAQSISVGGNDTSNATCDYAEKIDGDRAYSVGGNQITISNGIRHDVSGDLSRTVGAVQLDGAVGNIQENVSGSYSHSTGAATIHVVAGSHGEVVGGAKTQTSIAAELHVTKGALVQAGAATVTNLVGGLHYQKLNGDLVIKAPLVTMLGAVGIFKGGASTLKLGGGPIVAKGSKIAVKGAMVVKLGASLKMGPG